MFGDNHFYRATLRVSAVFAVARCPSVSVCLSVCLSRSCILSRRWRHRQIRPGSPITSFLTPSAGIQFAGNPFSGGAKYKGWWENFAIFDWNRRLSRERYEIGPWLLWNVNRKLYALYRMATFSMTWRTPNPVFKITAYLKSNILWIKLLQNANRKPYPFYRMVPLSMTLIDRWPGFQGHNVFRHWISQKRHDIWP